MNAFKFNAPVAIYYGAGCVENNAQLFKREGNRAAIITGPILSGRKSGAQHRGVKEVQEVLKAQGIEYILIDEAECDPPVESVVKVADMLRPFKPDFLVAVGGGSVMDTTKAASYLLGHKGEDAYKLFYGSWVPYGNTQNECTVPVFTVPTTAGTGSDVTGQAVLTRADTDTKQPVGQFLPAVASFLDPNYIVDSPYFLIDTGAMDALAHGVETYVNVKSNMLNRSIAEIGFKLFAEFKDKLYDKTLEYEDFEKMQLAATIMGMSFMQAGTTLPHGMSYPLSHHKGVNHGLGCAIFLGEYVRSFKKKELVQPIVEMCGFKTIDEFADFAKAITNRSVDIEVSEEELTAWADEFAALDYRLARHPEPISRDEIYKVYHDSLEKYIK